jgi:NADH:ubiquinone oxidoreductase subunit 2 (subunit N)
MSGVMTKVAVYGFIRIVFDLLNEPTGWSSMIILALGGATAALGVLYALMQHDLKRLLAYHTVENIGIIFIGLGLALAFQTNAMSGAAALAMTAALFQLTTPVLKPPVFMPELSSGYGSAIEHLGGLIIACPSRVSWSSPGVQPSRRCRH